MPGTPFYEGLFPQKSYPIYELKQSFNSEDGHHAPPALACMTSPPQLFPDVSEPFPPLCSRQRLHQTTNEAGNLPMKVVWFHDPGKGPSPPRLTKGFSSFHQRGFATSLGQQSGEPDPDSAGSELVGGIWRWNDSAATPLLRGRSQALGQRLP